MTYGQQRLESPKKKNRISLLEVLAVLYIMHTLLPAVGYYMPGIVYLGLFGLTFLLALPALYRKGAYIMLGFFAISLLTLITKLGNIAGAAVYIYGELQIYLYGMIAISVIYKEDPKRSRRLFWLILVMYAFTAVTTIIGNDEYPQASRFLATDTLDAFWRQRYLKANIGSFSLAYGLVLLTPLVIHLTKSRKINVIIGIGLLVLIGVTLMVMEYGMAVILYAASLSLLLIPKLTTKKIIVLLVIVLLFVFLFGGVLANVFEQISLSVDSETLAERFMAVADVLRGEDKTSSATAQNRTEFYNMSLRVFAETSLLGRWGRKNVSVTGGHSFVLDAMGDFGLLGIVALIVVFVTMYQLALKPYKSRNCYPYFLWTYLLACVLMIMNPKTYGMIFLLVIPLVGHAFSDEERSNAE